MKGIMLMGTSSDVGKSVLCTALCRLFSDRGMRVAPFKSQNMSNNSYVTTNGEEIGRAQGIQAEAAKVEPSVYMNPILLKPKNDQTSEVICFGKPYQSFSGKEYRKHFYEIGLQAIQTAREKLAEDFDYLVVEGAGSPVEINLNDREIVNMRVAEMFDLPVILVADIDRGGVFASIVGTLQLFTEEQKKRVVGIVINKFRGELSLFDQGVEWIEAYTKRPVLGVIPYINELGIEAEDSLAIPSFLTNSKRDIDIAVIKLPYVSNFTDLEPFRFEKDVSLRFVEKMDDFQEPDAIIIPGTKSTINDLVFLKAQGLDEAIIEYANKGGRIIGICGGYQMLGVEIIDKEGTDTGTSGKQIEGLKLLPISTQFETEKQVRRSQGEISLASGEKILVNGYEIHLGQTTTLPDHQASFQPFIQLLPSQSDGLKSDNGRLIGTYFHHLFHNDQWRTYWLNEIRLEKHLPLKQSEAVEMYQQKKQQAYENLGRFVEQHLQLEHVFDIVDNWGRK